MTSPSQDSYIRGDSDGDFDKNYGASDPLVTEYKVSKSPPSDYRMLMKFSGISIPSDCYVTSAVLNLYSDSSASFVIYPLTSGWAEGLGDGNKPGNGVTWITTDGVSNWGSPGGDYNAGVSSSFSSVSGGRTSIDLTPLVNYWKNGHSNNGFIILQISADEKKTNFDSRNGTNVPWLNIVFSTTP